MFNNIQHKTFNHKYNTTWANERCVEIPVVKKLTESHEGKILEVGNVLSHYYPINWDILDKFEIGKNVINEDIVSFTPENKYDLIISISTFEHIGYDDESSEKSSEKILQAFNNLKTNCLQKDGKIIITAPIGYNPDMDRLIFNNKFKFDHQHFLKRISRNKWSQVSQEQAQNCFYGKPFPYANAVAFGIFNNY